VISVGKFHLGTPGRTFCRTANRVLSAKFPELNFEASYFIGNTEITKGGKVKLLKHGVTAESVIRVELAESCKDRVLAKLNNDFQVPEAEDEVPKPKFASVKDLVTVS
jgi:hypothetical protein